MYNIKMSGKTDKNFKIIIVDVEVWKSDEIMDLL